MKSMSLTIPVISLAFLLHQGPEVAAQSGTRQSAQQSPTTSRLTRSAPLALQGYCPVCITSMKKWVAGKPEFAVVYDGHTYLFPGDDQKRMFQADPAKYTPALHGDCIVCAVDMKKRVPGSVNFAQFHGDRLFLFPSEAQRKMFNADPAKYADADLALGGKCAVCKVEMKQDVSGKPEYTIHYQGLRYLFPGPDQMKMFQANPGKYAPKPTEGSGPVEGSGPSAGPQSSKGSSSAVRLVSIQGKTGCAGCEHGVKLLGSPDDLGLAVTAGKRVYVVEDAKDRYPSIYESRFEGHKVTLTGAVLKEQGKFVWVRPGNLALLNDARNR